jgi:hypothetical protein
MDHEMPEGTSWIDAIRFPSDAPVAVIACATVIEETTTFESFTT